MADRGTVALAALVALAACNRSNPWFDGPGGETWSGSGGTGGSTGSGSTSASGSSGTGTDDGGTGGTGGGTGTDDGGSSQTGGGSSDTSSGGVWLYLSANQDAYIRQQFPSENHGNDQDLRAGSGSQYNRANRLLVQFDLSALQPGCGFSEAILLLYYFDDGVADWANVDVILRAHPLTQSWTESGAAWNTHNGNDSWATAGGDYDPAVMYERAIVGGQYGRVSWDVTDTVMDWCQDTLPDHGLIVRENPDNGGDEGRKIFHSNEYAADLDLRPALRMQLDG